jgi:hypothetical protein
VTGLYGFYFGLTSSFSQADKDRPPLGSPIARGHAVKILVFVGRGVTVEGQKNTATFM